MAEEIAQLIEKAAAELKAAGALQVFVFGSAAIGTLRENASTCGGMSGYARRFRGGT